MSVKDIALGKCVFIGWEEASEEAGHDRRFIAKITFEDVPNWPLSVVFGAPTIRLEVLEDDGPKQVDRT